MKTDEKPLELSKDTGDCVEKIDISEIAVSAAKMVEQIETAIVGKTETVRRAVLTLLCNGHLLIEDIPGVGKTTLAKALAKSIGGDFRRIQFTPDLLPSDITGGSIYNQRDAEFEFRPGPVFANVVLADEINRATPKTQSALLEAMEERTVTTDGITRDLPRPFFVIATQNSIEMTGTYRLPEAQLDRFFARLSLGYPDKEYEVSILGQQQIVRPVDAITPAITPQELVAMQRAIREINVNEKIRAYIVDVVDATRRKSSQLLMGSSPRGTLLLMRAAQGHAAMAGRADVWPDDVKAVAASVLAHRVLPREDLRAQGQTTESVIKQILNEVAAPVPVG